MLGLLAAEGGLLEHCPSSMYDRRPNKLHLMAANSSSSSSYEVDTRGKQHYFSSLYLGQSRDALPTQEGLHPSINPSANAPTDPPAIPDPIKTISD